MDNLSNCSHEHIYGMQIIWKEHIKYRCSAKFSILQKIKQYLCTDYPWVDTAETCWDIAKTTNTQVYTLEYWYI